jgi:hypothetical protein
MSGAEKPYYQETWFELVFFAAGCLLLALLFTGLMPAVDINPNVIQSMAMAKLFSEGRFLDAFARFNMPPIYPLLLALIIKLKHTTELPKLIEAFQLMNLGLCMVSALLVHLFVRRQLAKPYTFIITGLYLIAPSTVSMAWSLSPHMIYMVMSMACLLAIDISLSKESAMGGQLSRGEIILCGTFLGLGILSWQVGYLMLIAFFFVMLKRFGLKKSATVIAAIMLSISPFIARDLFYVVRSPETYMASSVSLVQEIKRRGVFRTMESYADNIMINLTRHAIGDLNLSSLDRIAQTPKKTAPGHIVITQEVWLRWLIGVIAIIGAIYGLYQYTGIGTLYLYTYVITALALLPSARLDLTPVLPLLLFYLYYGLLRTGQWMQRLDMPLLARIAIPVLTVWIVLCTMTTHLSHARGGPKIQMASAHAPKVMYMNTAPEPETRLEEAQTISAKRRAAEWLKKHTPSNARVGSPRPQAASALAKGNKGKGEAEQKALQSELGQYDYLVEEGSSKLSPAQAGSGYGLKLVYEDVPGRIRIWQVKPTL